MRRNSSRIFQNQAIHPPKKSPQKKQKTEDIFLDLQRHFLLIKVNISANTKAKKGTKKEQKYEKKKQKNFAMRLEKSLNIFKSELKNTVNLKRNKLKFINTKHRFFSRKKLFIDDIFLKKEERNFSKI